MLDPSGAASVGLDGTRDITFSSNGDLFVTGYLSHTVARCDWASQTYQPFVTAGSGGLDTPGVITIGPDGNVYVGDNGQNSGKNEILRYDGTTGAPLPAQVGPVRSSQMEEDCPMSAVSRLGQTAICTRLATAPTMSCAIRDRQDLPPRIHGGIR